MICQPVVGLAEAAQLRHPFDNYRLFQLGEVVLLRAAIGLFLVDGFTMTALTEVEDTDSAMTHLLADFFDETSGGRVPEAAVSERAQVAAAVEDQGGEEGDDELEQSSEICTPWLAGDFERIVVLCHSPDYAVMHGDGTAVGQCCDVVIAADFRVVWVKLYRRLALCCSICLMYVCTCTHVCVCVFGQVENSELVVSDIFKL